MYKKITHSIVEEHFDHPMAAKIRAGIRHIANKKAKYAFEEDDGIFGDDRLLDRPTTEIFNKTVFKADLENYLNSYTQKIIQISDTTTGTEEQLVVAFEELFDFVDNIKNFFNPFYNRELGEKMTTSFRQIASISTLLSHSVKAEFDSTPWVTNLRGAALQMGGVIINYNGAWPNAVIQVPMTEYVNAIIIRTNSVKTNDTVQITQATDRLYSSIGVFRNVIADGIIQQFPARFTV
jgi:hypothetical protein